MKQMRRILAHVEVSAEYSMQSITRRKVKVITFKQNEEFAGIDNCEECEKVFINLLKQKIHLRIMH